MPLIAPRLPASIAVASWSAASSSPGLTAARSSVSPPISLTLSSRRRAFASTRARERGRRSDDVPGYVHFVSRLVDAAGIDHVGIGTDMDGISGGAIFISYSRWPSLAAALVDHGYRPDEAAKVLGGNAQRVFQQVAAGASSRR